SPVDVGGWLSPAVDRASAEQRAALVPGAGTDARRQPRRSDAARAGPRRAGVAGEWAGPAVHAAVRLSAHRTRERGPLCLLLQRCPVPGRRGAGLRDAAAELRMDRID